MALRSFKQNTGVGKCRSCAAAIVWMPTAKGKTMPVDAETVNRGDEMYDASKGHVSHFATCPNAKEHRKQK